LGKQKLRKRSEVRGRKSKKAEMGKAEVGKEAESQGSEVRRRKTKRAEIGKMKIDFNSPLS
jgi:hypothetical protein